MNRKLPKLRIQQFKPERPNVYDENGVRIDIIEEELGVQPPVEKRVDSQ